jgi:hypothetical protein
MSSKKPAPRAMTSADVAALLRWLRKRKGQELKKGRAREFGYEQGFYFGTVDMATEVAWHVEHICTRKVNP